MVAGNRQRAGNVAAAGLRHDKQAPDDGDRATHVAIAPDRPPVRGDGIGVRTLLLKREEGKKRRRRYKGSSHTHSLSDQTEWAIASNGRFDKYYDIFRYYPQYEYECVGSHR